MRVCESPGCARRAWYGRGGVAPRRCHVHRSHHLCAALVSCDRCSRRAWASTPGDTMCESCAAEQPTRPHCHRCAMVAGGELEYCHRVPVGLASVGLCPYHADPGNTGTMSPTFRRPGTEDGPLHVNYHPEDGRATVTERIPGGLVYYGPGGLRVECLAREWGAFVSGTDGRCLAVVQSSGPPVVVDLANGRVGTAKGMPITSFAIHAVPEDLMARDPQFQRDAPASCRCRVCLCPSPTPTCFTCYQQSLGSRYGWAVPLAMVT